MPGAATRQVVDDLIRGDVLTTGKWTLGGREIDLSRDSARTSSARSRRRTTSSRSLPSEPVMDVVGEPEKREEMRLTGGHVTFGAGRHAFKRTLPRLRPGSRRTATSSTPPKER